MSSQFLPPSLPDVSSDRNLDVTITNCSIGESEYKQIIYDWNDTKRAYPHQKTLIELFEEQVSRTPQQIAIVYNEQELTYQLLNDAANQLARLIQHHFQTCHSIKITPDTLIAVCLDKTPELFIALLAVLKTGAAYVPIDPDSPAERVRFILKDTKSRLVLTAPCYLETLKQSAPCDLSILPINKLTPSYQAQPKHNPGAYPAPSNLAYVIYTSGTTGRPKGVMITHQNVINYYSNVSPYFDDVENFDFSTSFAFDLSVTTTLIPLLCGKKISIYPGKLQDVTQYIAHLEQKNIHFIKSTPSYLAQVFAFPTSIRIRKCFVGGEKLSKNQLERLLDNIDILYDEYGPTENTVGTSIIQKTRDITAVASIGKPYFNHKVYVLDDQQKPVSAGVIGELYVGGASLAKGYLNQPELTQERFIPNLFATEEDKNAGYTHLYRTGDKVRWLSDGNLEYIGRNDFQVKIRGYRIELAEIEHALSNHGSIAQCVVLAHEKDTRKGSEHTLVAYYVSHSALNEVDLLAFLKFWLPEYMLPQLFVHLHALPLTINGKVDRDALTPPDWQLNQQPYRKPSTPIEERMCAIWEEVLGIARVGVLDDFFSLGGDSIKCIQVMASLLREGVDCRVSDIYTHRTIEQLSPLLDKTRVINAESGTLAGDIGLLPVQYWFFDQHFQKINHWNHSFLVRVPTLSLDRLQKILPLLVERHDMLRASFPLLPDGTRGQIYGVKQCNLNINHLDISELPALGLKHDASLLSTAINNTASPYLQTLTSWQDGFDIEQGPLWQMGYITGYADGSARLYFAAHHLIIDSVSWRILINDIKQLYEGATLGVKGSSYRQWVNLISQYPEKHPEESLYWEKDAAESCCQYPPMSTKAYFSSFALLRETTHQLLGEANKAYHTEVNDLLLTALAMALSAYFGATPHRITLEGHGREELNDQLDLSQTLGWFTSIFPVTLATKADIAETIPCIKEYLRTIPNKGVGYGAFKRTIAELPNITFNYLGQFDSASGFWQVVPEAAGVCVHPDNMRPVVLNITAFTTSDTLHVSLSSYISQEACTQIAKSFEKQLLAIAAHCISQVRKGAELHTPHDFNTAKISSTLLNTLQKDRAIEAIYAANSLQQGFIYHAIRQIEQDDAYRVQMILDYYTALDIDAYQSAWQLVINKHPILRTFFNWDEGIIQLVSRQGHLAMQLHDLTEAVDKEQALTTLQKQDRLLPFDLKKPTLMRLQLIKMDSAHFVLIQNTHHSILDGLSATILLNQVHDYYIALVGDKKPNAEVDKTYLHAQAYIAHHRAEVDTYWATQLREVNEPNDINSLLCHATNLDAIATLNTPRQLSNHEQGASFKTLKKFVRQEGLTLNTVVQFAWHKLLQIYTGDSETIVGTTVSGRSIPVRGIESSVGLYINTLPLIIKWADTSSVRSQLHLFESQLAALSEHSFVDLAGLQAGGRRLFHSLYVAEYSPSFEISEDIAKVIPFQSRGTIEVLEYPLALVVRETDDSLNLQLKYDGLYLSENKAAQLLLQLRLILKQIPAKIHAPHHEISLLDKSEFQRIVYDWNNTAELYPFDKTLHRLFEEQVSRTPDAIALKINKQQMTYQALNTAANQLAQFLCQHHKVANSLIGVSFDHSFEMIISILAVLKAGAAYVPMDPAYPPSRLALMLQDTKSRLVLTQSHLMPLFKEIAPENTAILVVNDALYNHEVCTNLPDYSQALDLAYVIYTSGTTGIPKGVMVSHQNVANYLSSIGQNEALLQATTVDCSSSIAFDATIAVLFAPLIRGLSVVLCPQAVKREPALYVEHVQEHSIDLLRMTPSYLSALLIAISPQKLQDTLAHVRALIIGGEKANLADIRSWRKLFPQCNIINHYGPTETTVACALFNFTDNVLKNDKVLIGKAAHNHQFYVLDKFLHPLPPGVTGELYIGGAGVARGYLNQAELTAERFIENPFASTTRLYKTGDLVRWLPDGNLEFLGRNDFQVKIRGYRVELSEIEQIILSHDTIKQCVVLISEKPSLQLIAYYVSTKPVNTSLLKHHAEKYLPTYMVPGIFIALEAFPLTLNGKLDRQALPAPFRVDDTAPFISPRDEIEALACSIWQEILGLSSEIGVQDDFFRLGGHSILAIHAAHRMSQATKREITVADIFKHRTIAQLCTVLRTNDGLTDIAPQAEDLAPLSFAQERLWFIEQYEGGTDAFHIPLLFELDKSIHQEALERALQSVINRHEILRSVFVQDDQGVYHQQVQDRSVAIKHETVNASSFKIARQALLNRPFDLTTDLPVRISFFTLADSGAHYLMVVVHHIAFDAWSKNIFMTELQFFYQAILTGNEPLLPPLAIQYNDFAIWQRELIKKRMHPLLAYWKATLNGHQPLAFPTDYPRPLNLDYHGDTVLAPLSKPLVLKLKQLAESEGVTLYTVLITGFAVLLSKYTGQDDLLLGTPSANRQHREVAGLIGFFVNLLTLRIKLSKEHTLQQCLHGVHADLIDVQCHQDLPFATLVEALELERDASRHPLFQLLFNVDYLSPNASSEHLLKPASFKSDYNRSKLDLSVSLQEDSNGFQVTWQYATRLFKRETIERIAAHYSRVLTAMVETPNLPVMTFQVLTPAEFQQIVYDWNVTDKDYPRDKTIHQLFEEQVKKNPHKIAVVYEDEQLTYQELNAKANQLARFIRNRYKETQVAGELAPDTLIALCVERSMTMIISILGILKAGGAYVPIEPHNPIDRIHFVLNDTKSAFLLTQAHLLPMLKEACPLHTELLVVDGDDYAHCDRENLPAYASAHDLAYIIYTSGTTGLPKGVMVMHQGLCNIVHYLPQQLGLTSTSRILHFASIAFDPSVLQLFNSLTIGAELFILPESLRKDIHALGSYLNHNQISFAGIPPALLAHLDNTAYPHLQTLVVAGEAANSPLLNKWCAGRRLINAYGPTENTIGATIHHYEAGDSHTNIGRPIANVKCYVLDKNLMPVPVGVAGELYIGGAGVARGYLNQPKLTTERFIENPFASNTRLYKTGDLVRWLADGNLEFLGRNDFQVKIRGYRVELSEIEQVLLSHDSIEQCVVLVSEKSSLQAIDLHLVAYYVSKTPINSSLLKHHIERHLPVYMVPSVFMALETFPLTANGKLDRQALPAPLWVDDTTQFVAPRDELEAMASTIWQEILKISEVGVQDDFFRLGGHSILAIHAAHRMSQATKREITVADIFKHRTIAQLCTVLRTGEVLNAIAARAKDLAPLSFAQERLWFIEQYEEGTDAYHIPLLFELDKSINENALESALRHVINRHEILRTVFVQDTEGAYLQQVQDRPLVIKDETLTASAFKIEQQALLNRPFDLTTDFPIRLSFFTLAECKTRFLMVVVHHIAFDGWSKTIFLSELHYFYQEILNGNEPLLPPLSIQYNDFAIWQRELVKERMKPLLDYWKIALKGHQPLAFPTDFPRPLIMDYHGDVVTQELPMTLLNELQVIARTKDVSLYTLLLGGFSLLLSKYTGQNDLLIGTPVINRQHPELTELIGLFVNSLALRIQPEPLDTIDSYIEKIQNNLIEAQLHQDLPFEQLVNALDLPRDTSKHPLFQIMFTVQHDEEAISDIPWKPVELKDASQTAKFDIAVSIKTRKTTAHVSLQYATALFKRDTMERFLNYYVQVLNELLIKKRIHDCQILTAPDYQQIIVNWNSTSSDYPKTRTIAQLFELQAHLSPDNIALVHEDSQLTYRELDRASNQLAHFIRECYPHKTLPTDTLIGLCVERSLDMIIAILGILKAGGAYVPIDPDYQDARFEYIIKDTACELILTQRTLHPLFNNLQDVRLIFLDEKPYQHASNHPLSLTNTSNDLAYVLYTSGTTGLPKGVMIEHRSVICLMYSRLCESIDAGTKGTLWTNITFDVSVYEIFSLLLKGGELHILPDAIRLDEKALFHYLVNKQIASLYLPPFFVEKISSRLLEMTEASSLRKLLLGVEPIAVQHIAGFLAKNISITNAYGPTEATVSSTAFSVDFLQNEKTLPIGAPLNNELTYVLDANLLPVPVGVVGELYLGGDGLARGYLHQPELTRARFIVNPFLPHPSNRLYKTGDLVRWSPDGNLHYVGRADFQVKINGYRIEPGEIEQALLLHPAIEQNVVLALEKNSEGESRQYLAAYYTGTSVDEALLQSFLSTRLPDYMHPSAFIHLPELPLTANGKLDRNALARAEIDFKATLFVAPRHEMDAKVCEIWQSILHTSKVGITDDFFRLGGDSIASLQLISMLRYAEINCTIKDIFQCRTVKRLVDHVLANASPATISAEQGILEGAFGLLPIQQWFFEEQFSRPNHWNQAFIVRVQPLCVAHLESLLPALINHHDMLRVRFTKHNDVYSEQYYEALQPNYRIKRINISGLTPAKADARLISSFDNWQNGLDLENGPTWELAYIDGYADGSARLFFVFHHLIIDTVSWRILIDSLKRLYQGAALRSKTSSYRQWQSALQTFATTNVKEIDYWLKQIDYTPPNPPRAPHSTESVVLNKNLTSQLMREANRAYHTKTEDILITALIYALQATFGDNKQAITLEGHGRELIDERLDISETIGWFTTLYPVILHTQDTLSLTLQSVKDHLREIPNNGVGYGALKYYGHHKNLRAHHLPAVYFNYFGHVESSGDDWALVAEKTGTSIHPDNTHDFLALINAYISNEELRINCGFKIDKESRESLVRAFESYLVDIIHHCTQRVAQKQLMYTPTDFKAVKGEFDLQNLPLIHDAHSYYQPFEMTSIQKAYALGRLNQFEIGNVANHVYAEFSFPQLDIARFEWALNQLIQSNPEIRTVFDIDNLMQRYLPYNEGMYHRITVDVLDFPYHEEALSSVRNKLSHLVYEVDTYPLFHFQASQFNDRTILHMSFDLLLLDAQSRMKFFNDLTHLYENKDYRIPAHSITYRDYQIYMGLLKASPWYQTDKDYWREKLHHLPLRPKLVLSADPRTLEKPTFKLSKRLVSAVLWKKFKQKADSYGLSYASVLLSLYGFILSRFSETSDFLITMTLFNRYGIHPEVNNLWGDFTSTNLFGFSRKDGLAVDFFKHTHEALWDDIAHALYTGLDVQRDLMNLHQLEPTIAVSPIVFTCVVGETKSRTQALPYFITPDEQRDARYWIGQTSQAWIDLQATERDGCLSSGWLYVAQLFPEGFIDALNDAYCHLIEHLAKTDWHLPLPSMALSAPEISLINAANETRWVVAPETLVSLFAKQVQKRPKALAIIDAHGSYDYETLQKKSQHIAYTLHKEGVNCNQLVAVFCEKGFNQVAATLGIMMAGGAYLPINVEWPLGRIKDVLAEGNIIHVLVSDVQWQTVKDSPLINDYKIHRIETWTTFEETPVFSVDISPEDLAYVIFTSGSTGKPKGVCISHQAAMNTIMAVNQRYGVNERDVILALSDLSFDLSVYDLFGLLSVGGIVVLPDQTLSKEPIHWAALIKKHQVTLWNSVPQLMQLLLDNARDEIASLRLTLLSGDWVPLPLVAQIQALSSQPTVVSLGGATEASIWSIWYEVRDISLLSATPYGFPMPNQNVYVLNSFGEHCPVGVAGEIYLGGDGLACAYWQDEEKTRRQFIKHETLGRLYKTGDLGKWQPAGFIEFLGRHDNQIKRNGNRIELNEIAAKLQQIKGIDNALVCMHADRLIAYIVSADLKSPHPDGFNIERFKLEQQGLRKELSNTWLFNRSSDEAKYRLYKSYRQFSSAPLPLVEKLAPKRQFYTETPLPLITRAQLEKVIAPLQALKLADKLLPKYLYPSAGSTYAVQCYVHIPAELEDLDSGCYYYHPLEHSLQRVERPLKSIFCLEFCAYRPAIETLYGQDWARLAYLELGHMVYLLTEALNSQGTAFDFNLVLPTDNVLATLIFNTPTSFKHIGQHEIKAVMMQKTDNRFSAFDLREESIFKQASEQGHLLNAAEALVVFEGEHTPAAWVAAGFEAQRYMNYGYSQMLAYCPLGLRPYEEAIYTLALGGRRVEDEKLAESQATGRDLAELLNGILSQELPCYMVPQAFIPLETLPLSINGKIDFQALPLPDFTLETETYKAPGTALERALCAVWEDVLELARVGIADDFFRIGGDSVLSIHVTTKLRQQGIHCSVLAIFEYRTIERLSRHLEVMPAPSYDTDDGAIDFGELNISSELLERLQKNYQNTSVVEDVTQ
ncbi:MAG: amino acid adenylation domain-containing protein [Legionella sp.]|nr:amino acid adenylation domain-containing protein [Legionella sp.]